MVFYLQYGFLNERISCLLSSHMQYNQTSYLSLKRKILCDGQGHQIFKNYKHFPNLNMPQIFKTYQSTTSVFRQEDEMQT